MTQEFYALGKDRSTRAVRRFLDYFLPHREPYCTDYPIPEHSNNPHSVLTSEAEILTYMERHPNEPYALYWNGTGASSAQSMIFYTRDGKVIFGLADDSLKREARLKELADFVGAEYSMLGWEQRPPDTAREFIALCTSRFA